MCTGIQACSDYTKEETTGRKLNWFLPQATESAKVHKYTDEEQREDLYM